MTGKLQIKLREDFLLFAQGGYTGKGVTFDCGNGWYKLIREAGERLSAIPDCRPPVQIKEKFGTLRIYLTAYAPGTEDIVLDIETRSAITCERCGKPGEIRDIRWIRCYCDECYRLYKDRGCPGGEFVEEVEMSEEA